jgi:hypothetical protein
MLRLFPAFFLCAFFATVGPAAANPLCVQQMLIKLGYDPGKPDGALGKKTVAAAAQFRDATGQQLRDLSAETAPEWCVALKKQAAGPGFADAKSVNGIFPFDLDVTSVPQGVLSEENLHALWDLHETSKVCLEYRKVYGSGRTYKLPTLSAKSFAAAPQSVFPAAPAGLPACTPTGRQIARLNEPVHADVVPPPMSGLDNKAVQNFTRVYGVHEGEEAFDMAGAWFARHLASYRADPSGPEGRAVIDAMVAWAKGKALTKGIMVGGNGPVIFAVATLASSILNAYADVAPVMTAEEREVVGPWLNKFMIALAGHADEFRTQNHAAGYGLMIATWGLATGDAAAVQFAIDTYKLAIHDMRPDGSFAQDHSRGANGLSYNNLITGDLVMLAGLLQSSLGVDLFAYKVDGRSIHTAVDYAVNALKDPVAANLKYALPCPQAGDYMDHDRTTPFVDYVLDRPDSFVMGAYLPAYALMFPDREVSKQILGAHPPALGMAVFHPMWHAAPICTFGLVPSPAQVASVDINTAGAPRVVSPEEALRLQTITSSPDYVETAEMISHMDSGMKFNSNFLSKIKGVPAGQRELSFNVIGDYAASLRRPRSLQFVLNDPLGKEAPKGLAACGPIRTDVYEDGLHRVIVKLQPKGDAANNEWMLAEVDCIADALPKNAAYHLRFLLGHFADIATSLVASGGIEGIRNESLRDFFRTAAEGSFAIR